MPDPTSSTTAPIGDPVPATLPAASIAVDPSPSNAIGGMIVGAVLLIVSGSATVLGMVKAGKLMELASWLQGTEGAPWLAAVVLVGTLGWRYTSIVRGHMRQVLFARWAPNRVAHVVGEQKPVAPAPSSTEDTH